MRMYDVDGNLLNGVKSMYINNFACAIVTGCKRVARTDSGVRQRCVMPLWLSWCTWMG